jgi:hypothetical protein
MLNDMDINACYLFSYVYIYSIHRQVGNSNYEELTLSDLEQTEMQLDAALRRTRARKVIRVSVFFL